MSEWQPIETAPKDGTWIAVISREGGMDFKPVTACFCKGLWMEVDHVLDGKVDYDVWNVTHWMPLPEPPK